MPARTENVCFRGDCVAELGWSRLQSLVMSFSRPLVCALSLPAAVPIRGCLCKASSTQRRRGTTEKLGEPPQVLRGCCKQYFVSDSTQAPEPEPVEPEIALHMRKSHLNFLALAARLLK